MRRDAADAVPVPPEVARQAVAWVVELSGGKPDPALEADWRRWRAADAEHERAWRHIESVDARMRRLSTAPTLAALSASQLSRRQALGMLVAAGGVGSLLWVGRDSAWMQRIGSDHATAVGERRQWVLADGTRLHLNTDSAVDVVYGASIRQILLRRGEVLIETARDPAGRLFEVSTGVGTVRPVGTRFLVRDGGASVSVAVLDGAVELKPARSSTVLRLNAGQQAAFDRRSVSPVQASMPGGDAWTRGLVLATGTLGDFIDELSRHHPGHLGCDAAVADLRLSGVFPLDDLDAVLRTLEETLPVRARRRSRYWIRVGAA